MKPLLDRFDAMDVDGSGTLEVADLAWMFVQARENHQPPPERDEEQFQRKSFFFSKSAGPMLKAASFKKSKVALKLRERGVDGSLAQSQRLRERRPTLNSRRLAQTSASARPTAQSRPGATDAAQLLRPVSDALAT